MLFFFFFHSVFDLLFGVRNLLICGFVRNHISADIIAGRVPAKMEKLAGLGIDAVDLDICLDKAEDIPRVDLCQFIAAPNNLFD